MSISLRRVIAEWIFVRKHAANPAHISLVMLRTALRRSTASTMESAAAARAKRLWMNALANGVKPAITAVASIAAAAVTVGLSNNRLSMADVRERQQLRPLLLVHGLMGFGTLVGESRERSGFCTRYFRGVTAVLEQHGFRVFTPVLPPTAGVRERAHCLSKFVEGIYRDGSIPQEAQLHIIGHSMGGLDARYYISNLGGYERVLSLTTIASPHRGTCIVDWALDSLRIGNNSDFGPARALCDRVQQLVGLQTHAFYQLGRVYMKREFNPNCLDREEVNYFSYGAHRPRDEMPLFLRWSYDYLLEHEGENDGLVSVSSSQWGEVQPVIRANHYEEVNWQVSMDSSESIPRFDALALYLNIAESRLAASCDKSSALWDQD